MLISHPFLMTITGQLGSSALHHPDSGTQDTGASIFMVYICQWKNGRLVAQLCLILCNRMDCSPPGSSVHGFPRQEYWSGLPFPSPGSLIDPGIKISSFTSPVLASESSTTSTTWEVCQIAHSLLKLQPRNDRYYFCLYFYFMQGWGNRLLEGTNKLLCAPRPR